MGEHKVRAVQQTLCSPSFTVFALVCGVRPFFLLGFLPASSAGFSPCLLCYLPDVGNLGILILL